MLVEGGGNDTGRGENSKQNMKGMHNIKDKKGNQKMKDWQNLNRKQGPNPNQKENHVLVAIDAVVDDAF